MAWLWKGVVDVKSPLTKKAPRVSFPQDALKKVAPASRKITTDGRRLSTMGK